MWRCSSYKSISRLWRNCFRSLSMCSITMKIPQANSIFFWSEEHKITSTNPVEYELPNIVKSLRIVISRRIALQMLIFWNWVCMNLIATIYLVFLFLALMTSPKVPLPSFSLSLYYFEIFFQWGGRSSFD